MHVQVSNVDVNAFALGDLSKLFLHLPTNIGTVIEPGGVQIGHNYCIQVILVIAIYYGNTKRRSIQVSALP